jgi:hypothetical protein
MSSCEEPEPMVTLLRKTAWTLLVFTFATWITYAWFTQPYSAEFLTYSLLEQRFVILITASMMAATWAYTMALAVETVQAIVPSLKETHQ